MERKVLFTASTFAHIRSFHLPYLRRFREEGWTVHVACGGAGGELPWADRLIPLPLEKKLWAPGNLRAASILRRAVQREGYGLITTHTALASFYTRLALKGLRRRPRVVNMVHGYLFSQGLETARERLLLAAERLCIPQTDLVLTMNREDLALAEKYRLGPEIRPIPGLGVDFAPPSAQGAALRGEYGIGAERFLILCAAEFSPRKSQATLIRALAGLPERAVLALAGAGEELERCRALAKSLGVGERVLFPGHVGDMPRWYAACDALAAASRSEGLPFNVMEAMAAGAPAVVSAVKGHTDLIREGENGLLYPYGDEDACARQLGRLMADPALSARLGAQAARDAEDYRLERVLPQVWGAYESAFPAARPV